nr:uncharacterized protein LOC128698793 [Cherax quadricarinatus]
MSPEEPEGVYMSPEEPEGVYMSPEEPEGVYMSPEEPEGVFLVSIINVSNTYIYLTVAAGSVTGIPQRRTELQRSHQITRCFVSSRQDDLHYHFYPHNHHLFNLPECATQQVCNAVYKRLKFTQPLCQCPQGSDPCSTSYLANDDRTIELSMGGQETRGPSPSTELSPFQATTLIKTCEPVWSVRKCRKPRDWSILALQNTRTGKAHYLVICKCPDSSKLEGPLNHDQPTYAQVPGIRVYGMMCVSRNYRRVGRQVSDETEARFPWERVTEALQEGHLLRDLTSEEQQHSDQSSLTLP